MTTIRRPREMTLTRRTLSCVMVLLLTALPSAPVRAADDDHNLVGIYKSEGTNPDGSPYSGVVEIALHSGIFHLRWTLESGEDIYGFGIVTEHLFSVTYVAEGTPGVVVYVMEPGKPLQGRWVLAGIDGIFPETLTKIPLNQPTPQSAPDKPTGNTKRGLQV